MSSDWENVLLSLQKWKIKLIAAFTFKGPLVVGGNKRDIVQLDFSIGPFRFVRLAVSDICGPNAPCFV